MLGDLILKTYRMNPTDFTRKRKQPFVNTLLFMLNLLRKSLVVEIDNFLTHLNEKFRLGQQLQSFTSSAFIQNRKKIKPEVFKYLSEVIIDNYYVESNENIQLFKGFRILTVDGSSLTLPFTKELRKLYGEATNASEIVVVNAKISVLYDVLNRLSLDSVIAPVDTGERKLALTHFTKLKKMI